MKRLTRYILRQLHLPFLITALTLTCLILLPFALKALNVVVVNGQGFFSYLELLFYAGAPSLTLAIPIAFFIALVYALYILDFHNEMTAMFSAGFSRASIMRPVMIFATLIALLFLLTAFYARPWSENMRRITIVQIRADVISTMLRIGSFTNPANGITAFIRDHDATGVIHGILLQDDRNPQQSVSYMAETGALLRSERAAKLIMFNGVIQHNDRSKARGITTLSFDKYSYDLSELMAPVGWTERRIRELYPQDLFLIPQDASPQDISARQAMAHNYLALALYIFIYALLALDAITPVHGSQHSLTERIAIMSGVAGAMQILGIIFYQSAKNDLAYILGLYLMPPCLYLLSRLYMVLNPFKRKSFTAGTIRPSQG